MSDRLAEASRRRRPLRAVLAVIVVAAIGGAAYWFYRSDQPRPVPGVVPVIHSDAAPVKEAPKDPGGMIVPDQDSVLLNRQATDKPRVEELLPAPEPVLPRPVATPAANPAPQVAIAATPPAPPPAPAPSVVAPPAPPPLPAAVAPPPPVATGKGYRLQLGAVRSEDAAAQEWARLKRAQPDVLGKLGFTTARTDLGDKGIYYRIEAGPIADAAQAQASCDTLKSRKVGCILVKP